MDIVLNTNFNNPNLPKIQLPGFTDGFNRSAGTPLGMTDDGKPWRYENLVPGENPMPWTVKAPGVAVSGGSAGAALVDELASDGVLTAVVGEIDASGSDINKRLGLVFRWVDEGNWMYIAGLTNTAPELVFAYSLDGVVSGTTQITGIIPANGDTIQVELIGSSIKILHNGVPKYTTTNSHHLDATVHGVTHRGADGGYASWDSIEFVAS